jgi:DNA-directed RNA polymerase specialized sigma24 family protein
VTESVFDTILEEHIGLISRIISTFETNSVICDDLKQEVALALWRRPGAVTARSGPSSLA